MDSPNRADKKGKKARTVNVVTASNTDGYGNLPIVLFSISISVVGLSRQMLPGGNLVVGLWHLRRMEDCLASRGHKDYPGSASPLEIKTYSC